MEALRRTICTYSRVSRERDGFDEFRDFVVGALRFPEGDAIFAGVVSSGSIFGPAGGTSEIGDVEHAELNIDVGIEERGFGVADFALLGENPAGLGKNLHQADGVGVRNSIGLKGGFLANEAGGEHRIEIVAFRLRGAAWIRTGSGNKTFQTLTGTSLNLRASKLGTAMRP